MSQERLFARQEPQTKQNQNQIKICDHDQILRSSHGTGEVKTQAFHCTILTHDVVKTYSVPIF